MAAKAAAEEERAQLQGEADESRTIVGQWKEAYEKLNSQYEGIQVSHSLTMKRPWPFAQLWTPSQQGRIDHV